MGFSRWQRYALSILSGLLMVISFPYTGSLFPLAFIAWCPLLLVEQNIFNKKYRSRKVLLHAYITFLIYNIGTTYWIYYSIGGEVGAIMAYLLNGFIMALVFYLFHLTKKNLGRKLGYTSLIFFWVGFEFIHFNWELSWPWLNLGNTFSIVPQIVQWYSYTGILGGTLWILVANLIFFKIIYNLLIKKEIIRKQLQLIVAFLALLILPSSLSYWSYSTYKEPKSPIEIVVTQPNVDPYNEKFNSSLKEQLDKVLTSAENLITDKTAIVLAPETAIAMPFNEDQYNQQNTPFDYVQNHVNNWGGTSLFTGASTYKIFNKKTRYTMRPIQGTNQFYESFNTSVLVSKNKPPQFIHKSKLVLGVEKIPFTTWFPFLEQLSIKNGGTSGTLGSESEPRVIRSNGFTFAPVICYESIYGDWIAKQCQEGAQVIFVITNDGWWGDSPGYKQHASFSRLRAIETRRYVARSANTGISSIINERGDVIKATDYWVMDAFRGTVQLNDKPTFYITFGDLIGRSFVMVFLFIIILNILNIFKKILKPKSVNKEDIK